MSPTEFRDLRDEVDILRAQIGALNDERRHDRDRIAQLEAVLAASLKGIQEATVLGLRLHAAAPPRPRS